MSIHQVTVYPGVMVTLLEYRSDYMIFLLKLYPITGPSSWPLATLLASFYLISPHSPSTSALYFILNDFLMVPQASHTPSYHRTFAHAFCFLSLKHVLSLTLFCLVNVNLSFRSQIKFTISREFAQDPSWFRTLSYTQIETPVLLLSRTFAQKEQMCSVTQSRPTLCNLWTVACQAPLSMGFSRQEYWSGLPFPSPKKNIYMTFNLWLQLISSAGL